MDEWMRISNNRLAAAVIAGFHGTAMVTEGSVCISRDIVLRG